MVADVAIVAETLSWRGRKFRGTDRKNFWRRPISSAGGKKSVTYRSTNRPKKTSPGGPHPMPDLRLPGLLAVDLRPDAALRRLHSLAVEKICARRVAGDFAWPGRIWPAGFRLGGIQVAKKIKPLPCCRSPKEILMTGPRTDAEEALVDAHIAREKKKLRDSGIRKPRSTGQSSPHPRLREFTMIRFGRTGRYCYEQE